MSTKNNNEKPNLYPPYRHPKINGIQRKSQTKSLLIETGNSIQRISDNTGNKAITLLLNPLIDLHICHVNHLYQK